jgi:hypothetical protein
MTAVSDTVHIPMLSASITVVTSAVRMFLYTSTPQSFSTFGTFGIFTLVSIALELEQKTKMYSKSKPFLNYLIGFIIT